MSNLFENKRKYTHVILGIYSMTEPTPHAIKVGHWASMNGEQYVENSATGEVKPFRFLRELLLMTSGKRLYASYYETLGLIVKHLSDRFDEWTKKSGKIIDTQAAAHERMNGSIECRIRVCPLREDETKVDADILFYLDGSETPIKDIDEVFRAKGLAACSTFIKELLIPLAQTQVNPEDGAAEQARRIEQQKKDKERN